MPGEFTLNKNARFYIAHELSDDQIREIMNAAKESALDEFSEHERFRESVSSMNFRYSTALFLVERELHFHSDPDLKDRIYGYIVLIEIDGHLVVMKKNCSDITNVLDEKFEKISYEHLAAVVDTGTAEFQKINTRNMTISERALRNRSYEAANLKGIMSLHSAGRSIPSYLRVKDGGSTRSVTLAAGRLVEISDRQSLDAIAAWARSAIREMSDIQCQEGGFLRNFAKSVNLTELETEGSIKPNSLLLKLLFFWKKLNQNQSNYL